ncbi:heavy metal translocating P-type ATPase [Planctomicrobium piriforme]|uniref:P-type Zn(2+) transporter n=1 Tax=Planctomicrobium piriforme TaxID=1576369 RepID=A0A1I3B3J4_9PLAN|nr:heavy metal translocating P-type ATPase [Planctomicrobium piriforme]SFH56864.1 ATPase, P-type (transporting), HAD superfamily, subfamily IC/heavy metal translocating P-type ATPase [Planctomicrobium piriforme]
MRSILKLAWQRPEIPIAALAVLGIAAHLVLRFALEASASVAAIPLNIVLALGGIPLVLSLTGNLIRGEFGSDLLAGISIVTSALLDERLAGSIVVLMLSGGQVLERFAVAKASSALEALAKRMPAFGHRLRQGTLQDVFLEQIQVGDSLVVFPFEICPVDGTVLEGHGSMDESYLTGEPFRISKSPGSTVLSGAVNSDQSITVRADQLPVDSRYAKIMEVMRSSQQQRSRLRRLGDQLGAYYTPVAIAIGVLAWLGSGDPLRFLAVLVTATPCPLLIAIPVAVVGTISRAASRGIIIKDPAVLELSDTCRTAIFDKTGTLTMAQPTLVHIWTSGGLDQATPLQLAASLERYSKHPLASAVLAAAEARHLPLIEAESVSEKPGEGLTGLISGRHVWVTSRKLLARKLPELSKQLPAQSPGLECLVVIDDRELAVCVFRDEPRPEGRQFIQHLPSQHLFKRVLIVSGDRDAEVNYLASQVGISEVFASQSPEEKLAIVKAETQRANTMYVGDGINDAPAMTAATVGVAFGHSSEITAEAAGAVIMDSSLERLDEFLHLGRRMRRIALQSAVGGMALSLVGMGLAAFGYLPPVAGAVFQEVIDVFAVLNAMRVILPVRKRSDLD